MYLFFADATFTGCTFTENAVNSEYGGDGGGGGLYTLAGENGSVVLEDCSLVDNWADGRGGAINSNAIEATLTVTNCTFRDNFSVSSGGAVEHQGDATFTDCTFIGNQSEESEGGAMRASADTATTVVGCTFTNNAARRGGALDRVHTVSDCTFIGNRVTGGGGGGAVCGGETLVGCTFINNVSTSYGGGVYGTETLVDCTFIGNVTGAQGGGAYSSRSLVNCLFVANTATDGGGLYKSGPCSVVNCTFAGNIAERYGGGIYTYWSPNNGGLTLTNSIVWGNRAEVGSGAQIFSHSNAGAVQHSCIQGGWPGDGDGNLDLDPRFVRNPNDGGDGWGVGDNDDFGDVHLTCASPCLDAGLNDVDTDPDLIGVQPLPATDLEGNPRIVDGVVDMGPYEGPRPGFVATGEVVVVPEGEEAVFTVVLACDPLGPVDVEVAVESGDPDIAIVSGADLAFNSANFATPQPVTLAAAEDADRFEGRATIRISGGDIPYRHVTARERENDVPPIVYVDEQATGADDGTSWADAFVDLQRALGLAAGAVGQVNEIWIAAGVYRPSELTDADDPRSATFLIPDDVGVYGGFVGAYAVPDFAGETTREERDPNANETVLNGDLNDDDTGDAYDPSRDENAWRAATAEGEGAGAVLDGLIFTGGGGLKTAYGAPTVSNCTFRHCVTGSGAGLSNRDGSPVVRDCVFHDNVSTGTGGGINSSGGEFTLSNCLFRGNTGRSGAGGASVSNATVTNCTFEGNSTEDEGGGFLGSGSLTDCVFVENHAQDEGGAIYHGTLVLTRCSFLSNSAGDEGGALSSPYGTASWVTGCYFRGNGAYIGGALYQDNDGTPTINNSVFRENTARYGGAIFVDDEGTMRLTNCRLENNVAELKGGGIRADYGDVDFTNCLLLGNVAGEEGGGIWTVSNNVALTNCSVVANSAGVSGGGIRVAAFLGVSNSVLWGNTAADQPSQIHVHSGTAVVSYSCIQDADPDDGDIPFGGAANGNIDSAVTTRVFRGSARRGGPHVVC